jgi:beta-phosphoglucomutase-like phosphatase (HAD superfamily)/GTP:adenosylcobinamide-phosphate guanylyltransferase
MKILIPIGGKGERFIKANYTERKPLINILDKYMIFYVLDNLRVRKDDIIYIIYNQELDKYFFNDIILKKYPRIILLKVFDTKGAAETIKIGLDSVIKECGTDDKCMIFDCDTFYTEDVIDIYRNMNDNAVFYTINQDEKPIYSYIDLDDCNNIINIKEKVKISDNANTGIYCFKSMKTLHLYCTEILEGCCKTELYTSMVIDNMIKNKEIFKAILLDKKYVFNLGTPEQVKHYIDRTLICLFDLDGTLVETDIIYKNIWKNILNDINITLDDEMFYKYVHGKSDQTVVTNLLNNDENLIRTISEKKDKMFVEKLKNIKIIENAIEFITYLFKNGHKVSIVTNCNRKVAESILQYCNIPFEYLIIGNECSNPKPSPDPYVKGSSYYCTVDNIIIFEDSLSGINSALGVYPKCLIGITTMYKNENLISYGVDISINNYNELDIEKIKKIDNKNLQHIKQYIFNSISSFNISSINDIKVDKIKLKGGFICDIINVTIKSQNVEYKCVLKIDNKNNTVLSSIANELDLYEREYYFYEHISKYVNVKIPTFSGIIKDENQNNIGILMSNLFNEGCRNNINLNNQDIDISLNIIRTLSAFHSKFWNKNLISSFTSLKKHNDILFQPAWQKFINIRIETFKSKWKNILTKQQLVLTDRIAQDFTNNQNRLSKGHLTLCHGDFKAPNLFLTEKNEPVFIDWQYISIGKGVQDLVFFMIESFDSNIIKKNYALFKNYYYIKITENGIQDYSWKQYEKDIIDSIFHFPFFVAIWFGTINEDELLDKNFPYFFIKKLYNFIDVVINNDYNLTK